MTLFIYKLKSFCVRSKVLCFMLAHITPTLHGLFSIMDCFPIMAHPMMF